MIRSWALAVIVALALVAQGCEREPVRSELARLQKQAGLNLVSVYDSEIYTVDFAKRSKEEVRPFLGSRVIRSPEPIDVRVSFS